MFTVTVSGNTGTTGAPASVGPLASGAGTNVQVVVPIPAGAGIPLRQACHPGVANSMLSLGE
ncbi:MAG TPA: hypothetical protein VLG46_09135 [Anaerolineae bacterium]|nr:hypothetical protein [Anaerolineae bacterium]